ncbi:MAG: DNA polymerase Y family protein [Terriglobia bacterium]
MFACLYIPDFMIQANLRGEPDGAGEGAIALVEGVYPRVVAATRAAREAGVIVAMTKAQAAQLACTRLRSLAQEDSAHAALLDCARSCSPRVEDTASDLVVIGIEGLEKFLGPPRAIAARLQSKAEELGLKIHVGIAANPDAAALGARGFQGIMLIPPGEEEQALGSLPVSILNPNPETLEILERWGISRLSELAALPPLPLSERLGQEGVRLQELARGRRARALIVTGEAERFEESWELETPAATLDELDFVLSSLLTRLTNRLAIRSMAAQELRLRLDFAAGMEPEPSLALEEMKTAAPDASVYERSLRFPLPLCNAKLFFKLWRLRLESETPRAPVAKVTLAAEPARPRPQQGGLFTPLAPDPEKLELTLARIAVLVGDGNAGSPELIDTHRPHAFRMMKFSPPETAGKAETGAHLKFKIQDSRKRKSEIANSRFKIQDLITNHKSEIANPKSRIQNPKSDCSLALRLFRPPLPARVELSSDRPTSLSSSRVRGRIVSTSGPWRRSGGWWEEQWSREEWDIEIRSGKTTALYCLYYDRARDEWYLEGEYD